MGGEIQTVEQSFLWEGTKHNQFKQFSGIQTLLVTNPFEGSTAFENNGCFCRQPSICIFVGSNILQFFSFLCV